MSNAEKAQTTRFGLTWVNKIWYMTVPLFLSAVIIMFDPAAYGWMGMGIFILLALGLGLITFFISAGWSFQVEVGPGEIRIRDRRTDIQIPNDKVGLVVRNAGFPFPTVWLVLKGAAVGNEIPQKGVDPKARELIEQYMHRNPGKRLTYVPVPGGYLRSVPQFAAEIQRRIPPISVDSRLTGK